MVKKITLPAVEVEVPRMGMVVYVSPKIGVQDNKWTCMFVAEIAMHEKGTPEGTIELQAFHLKCRNEKDAKNTAKVMSDRLKGAGSFPFIQTKF